MIIHTCILFIYFIKNILLHLFKNGHIFEERPSTRAIRQSNAKCLNIPDCNPPVDKEVLMMSQFPTYTRNTQTQREIIDHLQ